MSSHWRQSNTSDDTSDTNDDMSDTSDINVGSSNDESDEPKTPTDIHPSDSEDDLPLTQMAKRVCLKKENAERAPQLNDDNMHRLRGFVGPVRNAVIICALYLTPDKLAETLCVNIELASAWKRIAHRLWELQVMYIAPNLRESNFDITIAARDIDDPRIDTDAWSEIR